MHLITDVWYMYLRGSIPLQQVNHLASLIYQIGRNNGNEASDKHNGFYKREDNRQQPAACMQHTFIEFYYRFKHIGNETGYKEWQQHTLENIKEI